MFQNLGRLLTEFYFPEEARQVRGIITAATQPGAEPPNDATASASVLGLSFEALGLGVAKVWELPPTLQGCMRKPTGEPPTHERHEPGERLRWLTFAANQVADTLLRSDPEQAPAKLATVAKRYARVLGVESGQIEAATELARQRLAQTVQALGLQVAPQSPAWRLFSSPAATGQAATVGAESDALQTHSLQATMTRTLAQTQVQPRSSLENACEVLAAGIQDITDTLVADFELNDVLRMIVETMYRALGFQRIVFCLREPKTESLHGRFGLGEGAEALAAGFKVPLKSDVDLFGAACLKGADVLIADISTGPVATRLPAWYRRKVKARAILLLPVLMKGVPIALIYADKVTPGGVDLGEKELSLLRTLRNQVVMAFKQSA
ncbi:MAG: GAF domain-containing protein [Rhizobacter sp.]